MNHNWFSAIQSDLFTILHTIQGGNWNRPVAQIPQCTTPITYNIPLSSKTLPISVTKMVHWGYLTEALCDL